MFNLNTSNNNNDHQRKQKPTPKKQPRVTVLNQTNSGMQPWHKMTAAKRALDNESDDGIFSRHKDEVQSTGPAEFDGGILLLDAEEALQSILDSDSA